MCLKTRLAIAFEKSCDNFVAGPAMRLRRGSKHPHPSICFLSTHSDRGIIPEYLNAGKPSERDAFSPSVMDALMKGLA